MVVTGKKGKVINSKNENVKIVKKCSKHISNEY